MIHIIQCLCPQRHCVLAVAYDDAKTTGKEALELFQSAVLMAVEGAGLNPWCGLCQSQDWFYEDGVTRFTTLEEAKPFLKQCEADQLASRAIIDETRASRN